jgi:hypothetical protein
MGIKKENYGIQNNARNAANSSALDAEVPCQHPKRGKVDWNLNEMQFRNKIGSTGALN